jgi:CubicO group peptidase (beta-lactamase class C family)
MRLTVPLSLVLAVAGSACAPRAADQPAADAPGQLQALLDSAVAKGVPGLSAAVADSSGIVWTGVAGKANLETGAPITPDLLFGMGSITKTFVAVVVLQLVDEGKLSLDATPASLLGSAVDGIPNADRATVAQLLSHTGGVPSWEDDSVWIHEGRGDRLDPKRIWGKTQTLPYIKGHDPLAPPGQLYSYANTNFTLLGMIVEKITGHDAVDEIHQRIFEPLGLHDIHLEGFEPVPQDRLPHRYHWATPDFRRDAGVNAAFPEVRPDLIDASASNLSVEWTAGGMIATARDLARYGEALRDGKLLSPAMMKVLTDWQPAGNSGQVGHNVFRRQVPDGGPFLIGHSCDVLGFTGALYWVEGRDVVVAVLANVGAMHAGKVPGTAYTVARDPRFVALATEVARGKR